MSLHQAEGPPTILGAPHTQGGTAPGWEGPSSRAALLQSPEPSPLEPPAVRPLHPPARLWLTRVSRRPAGCESFGARVYTWWVAPTWGAFRVFLATPCLQEPPDEATPDSHTADLKPPAKRCFSFNLKFSKPGSLRPSHGPQFASPQAVVHGLVTTAACARAKDRKQTRVYNETDFSEHYTAVTEDGMLFPRLIRT